MLSPKSKAGTIGEYLVAADLLKRGYEVTKPLVDVGDDYHVHLPGGWVSIQVKCRRPNRKDWRPSGQNVTSDILAIVDRQTGEIRYIPELP